MDLDTDITGLVSGLVENVDESINNTAPSTPIDSGNVSMINTPRLEIVERPPSPVQNTTVAEEPSPTRSNRERRYNEPCEDCSELPDGEYHVEKILKYRPSTKKSLIKWLGYEDTT